MTTLQIIKGAMFLPLHHLGRGGGRGRAIRLILCYDTVIHSDIKSYFMQIVVLSQTLNYIYVLN